MKHLPVWIVGLMAIVIVGCTSSPDTIEKTVPGGYLDSAYVSARYRIAMDSIQAKASLPDADLKVLQRFMRTYRDSIQGHPTYRELLDNAKGLATMRNDAIGLTVESMNLHTVQKIVEVRLVMTFENKLNQALHGFTGNIWWLDEKGDRVMASPEFSVAGPFEPGAKKTGLRLEYALYKPTGNELSDPRNSALRDTLNMISEIYKRKNLKSFSFQIGYLRLANGLTASKYWLMPAADRQQLKPQPQPEEIALLKWADANVVWINKLRNGSGPHNLHINPVLTERGEISNGKMLILDRTKKVYDFFNIQKHIPNGNINKDITGKSLVLLQPIDFWGWPMEISIYESE